MFPVGSMELKFDVLASIKWIDTKKPKIRGLAVLLQCVIVSHQDGENASKPQVATPTLVV